MSLYKELKNIKMIIILMIAIVFLGVIISISSNALEDKDFFNLSGVFLDRIEYRYLYGLIIFSVLFTVFLKSISTKFSMFVLITIFILAMNGLFTYTHRIGKEVTFNGLISYVSQMQPGYFISGLSHVFSVGNKKHKPYLYYYTPSFYSLTKDNDYDNEMNIDTWNAALDEEKENVYTIISGKKNLEKVILLYPGLTVLHVSKQYNDIANYKELGKKILSDNESKYIYIVKLIKEPLIKKNMN
jgi:hypothetical protein